LNSRTVTKGALASLVLLLLVGGNAAFAETQNQTLAINTGGSVLNAGDQKYYVHGGSIVSGTILGQTLITTGSNIQTPQSIAVDNSATSTAGSDGSGHVTVQFTVGTGQNRLLIVGGTVDNSAITAVTYNGKALSQAVADTQLPRTSVWYLVNPPSGTASVVVTSSASRGAVIGVLSLTGVDQGSPIPTTAKNDNANGFSSPATVSITNANANAWVMDVVSSGNSHGLTNGPAPEQWSISGSADSGASSWKGPLAANTATTFSWTLGATDSWNDLAFEIKAAGGQASAVTAPTLSFSLQAEANGLGATGSAQFQITGTTAGGAQVIVQGQAQIVGAQSQWLPIGCTTTCSSGIPVFFVGAALTSVTIGQAPAQQIASTILFESPYFNPWGNPILIVSTDGAIVVATTYDKATLDWKGTTVTGTIQGSLGSNPVQGTMTLSSNEHEDFVAGVTTYDNGTMSFTSVSSRSLNVQGTYQGTSVIPKPGSLACGLTQTLTSTPCTSDCSAWFGALGLPAIPGTCTQTGFQSTGQFSLTGQRTSDGGTRTTTVTGSYSTTWSSPALGFVSIATATVTVTTQGSD
jgi:hypothetical protein